MIFAPGSAHLHLSVPRVQLCCSETTAPLPQGKGISKTMGDAPTHRFGTGKQHDDLNPKHSAEVPGPGGSLSLSLSPCDGDSAPRPDGWAPVLQASTSRSAQSRGRRMCLRTPWTPNARGTRTA